MAAATLLRAVLADRQIQDAWLQVDKLLQRIKLQAAGQAEAPPITLPDWINEEDLQDDDEDDDIAASAAGGAGYLTHICAAEGNADTLPSLIANAVEAVSFQLDSLPWNTSIMADAPLTARHGSWFRWCRGVGRRGGGGCGRWLFR